MAKNSTRQRGVYKRGNRWYIRYAVDGRDVRESIGTSYEAAVKAYHSRQLEIAEGKFQRNMGFEQQKTVLPSFNDFADRFLKEYCQAPGKKPSLWEFHDKTLRALRPFFGDKRLDEISKSDVKNFKHIRARQVSRFTGKQISPKTVNRALATLKRMFNVAIHEWDMPLRNPCEGVAMFPEKQGEAVYLSQEECARLIEAAESYFRPIIITAIHTGMRRNEILSLTWDRIDMANRVIRLDEGKTVRTEPEYVPIDDTLAETFSRLPRRGCYVFLRSKGPGPLKGIRRPFLKALERSGIAEERRKQGKPSVRFHDLRHTTASQMVMAGLPLEAVQKMLRHKDIATTQRYAHLSPDYMMKAAHVLDHRLSTGTKTGTVMEITIPQITKKLNV